MMRKIIAVPRCSNGIRCVAYPTLGEPAKLSSGNPGPRCFACEERRVASELETAAAKKKAREREQAKQLNWAKSNELPEHIGKEHAQAEQRAREVLELRRSSVLTCERGLRSALASGDERLVRRWSRSLREAKDRLAWAEADLSRTEKRARSEQAS